MMLVPGDYLVELAFERSCQKDVLERALHAMGWSDVAFDQSEVGLDRTGAMASARSTPGGATAAPAASRFSTRATAAATMARPAAAVPARATATVPGRVPAPSAPPPVAVRATASAPITQPAAAVPARATATVPGRVPTSRVPSQSSPPLFDPSKVSYDGGRLAPSVPRPSEAQAFRRAQTMAPARAAPSAKSKYDQPITPAGRPGESVSSPGESAPPQTTAEEPTTVETVPEGYVPEEYAPEAPAVRLEQERERLTAAPQVPLRQERLATLWRRWVEWGSPFALSAAGEIDREALAATRIAGDDAPSATRVRFLGRLTRPLQPRNPPGARWIAAHRLTLDVFAPLDWAVRPHLLRPRAFYEMRFLVREKSAPRREDVKTLMGQMGFAPLKLSLVQRNVKLPNRPAALAVWVGIGQWLYPESMVTVEDPFWFEQVRELPVGPA